MDRGTPDVSFDWDDENISHLARHRIKPSEVEEVFHNSPAIRGHEVVNGEDRWTSVGATESLRVLVLVFTVRGEKIRPITGWDADGRTKKEYFSERGT
ncbi:MAG: BrnT family toxin [Bryobacteraceae bacterium]